MMSTAELTHSNVLSTNVTPQLNLTPRFKRELRSQFVALSEQVNIDRDTYNSIPRSTARNGIRVIKNESDTGNITFRYEEIRMWQPEGHKAVLEIVTQPEEKTNSTQVTKICFGDSINGTIVFEMKKDGHPVVYSIPPKNGVLPSDFWLMQGKSFELFRNKLLKRSVLSKPMVAAMSVLAAVSLACSSLPDASQERRPFVTVDGAWETRDTQEIPLDQVPKDVIQTVEDSCVRVEIQHKGSNGDIVTTSSSGTITEAGNDLVIAIVKHSFTGEKQVDPNTKEKKLYTPESVVIEYKGVKLPAINFSDSADFKVDDVKDVGVLGINLARLNELAGGSLPDFKTASVNSNWTPRIFDANTPEKPLIFCGYPGSTLKKDIRAFTLPVVKNQFGYFQPILPPRDRLSGNQNYYIQFEAETGKSGGGVFSFEKGHAELIGVISTDLMRGITVFDSISPYPLLRSQLRTNK